MSRLYLKQDAALCAVLFIGVLVYAVIKLLSGSSDLSHEGKALIVLGFGVLLNS